MRRTRVMVALAGAVAAWCAASLAVMAAPAAGAVARAGSWGKAIEVPGLARLSAGHGGTLVAVSCSSPGNCSADGNYTDHLGRQQAFVVSEKNGSWGSATEVPRLAALNTGKDAELMSLSCSSAGNCAAGGFYTQFPPQPRICGQREERRLGQGDAGARGGGVEWCERGLRARRAVVRVGGQLRGRRELLRRR